MKIYTKTGDKGSTSLYGGTKVPKNHYRIETYGTVDELNATIACVLAENKNREIEKQLFAIQKSLFVLGAELATPKDKLFLANGKSRIGKTIQQEEISQLEQWIDEQQASLSPQLHFILPGGGKASAQAHLARTVCRRAERQLVALNQEEPQRAELLQYLNRLSDYLFSLARVLAKADGVEETEWIPEK